MFVLDKSVHAYIFLWYELFMCGISYFFESEHLYPVNCMIYLGNLLWKMYMYVGMYFSCKLLIPGYHNLFIVYKKRKSIGEHGFVITFSTLCVWHGVMFCYVSSNQINLIHVFRIKWKVLFCLQFLSHSYTILYHAAGLVGVGRNCIQQWRHMVT